MPGLFIDVKVAADAAKDAGIARKLTEACPVDIFEAGDAGVRIVEGVEDTTAEKIKRMEAAGISVAERIEEIPELLRKRMGEAD